MSLSTATSRPGPLCEWSLDHFLSSIPGGTSRPNKRPLSPGGPSLFSPAKRRILTQEGIYSPEKTRKTPYGGSRTLFGDLLAQDAKPLDFGLPRAKAPSSSSMAGPSTPARGAPERRLALSPEIPSKTSTKSTPRRPSYDDDDFFATPERLPSSKPSQTPLPLYNLAPRELPTPPDPQSIHYPGFHVYRDAYIPVANPAALASLSQNQDEEEDWKENIVPRRKTKRAITDPVEALMTPRSKKLELEKFLKAKSTPATPKKTAAKERLEFTSPTPRRIGLRSGSPKVGSSVISQEEMKLRRRMLRDEVDEDASLLDDEDLQLI